MNFIAKNKTWSWKLIFELLLKDRDKMCGVKEKLK